MALIYLRHSVHGTKLATMEQEAENDEQNGWVRYTHDTPSISEEIEPTEEPVEIAAPANKLEVKRRRKTTE